jgi:hypothetical protein
MRDAYDWTGFYTALCAHGPSLLAGLDDVERELVAELARTTDTFWSDGLQEALAVGAAEGDLRGGVVAALELWRENVLTELIETFGFEIIWSDVTVDVDGHLVDDLVAAASGDGCEGTVER